MVMVVIPVLLGIAFVIAAYRRRKLTLAGLNSSRPQFIVEPPARRMGPRSQERF